VADHDQPTHQVTRILEAIQGGDLKAADELLPIVYDELRRLAARRLSQEKPGQTLQATALVHEAYIRLVGSRDPGWANRRHFFMAAAEAMRRILVDRARRKASARHGGGRNRVLLDEEALEVNDPPEQMVALNDALDKLAAEDGPKAELVKLRYFAGLTIPEVATAMGISLTTAKRYWFYSRAWLMRELGPRGPRGDPTPDA